MRKYLWLLPFLLIGGYYLGRYLYFLPAQEAGTQAPNISATLPDGKPFELTNLKGQYVLLDFWGSWCGPCRAEGPALRQLWDTYGHTDAGFTIVSIGVERDQRRWTSAIATMGKTWPYHILDEATNLRFFDGAIASQYGVKAVPSHFLLNPAGQIVAVDPSLEEVSALLAEKLTN